MYAINPFNMYVRLLKYRMVNAKHNLFLSEYKKYRMLEIGNTEFVRQDWRQSAIFPESEVAGSCR